MYGEFDTVYLARHNFQIGIIFCAKPNNKITVKSSPWYSGRDHSTSSAFDL